MKKSNAVLFRNFGEPADVVEVVEEQWQEPQPVQASVVMRAAPINPADLNVIEGKYPVRPDPPAVPGVEGAGFVETIGADVRGVAPGDLVILPHGTGTWRERVVVEAERLIKVPADIPPEQAAMLKINPPTAWRMLHDFVGLDRGDWLVQNAANSSVGRAVIAFARACGWRTVNVVRRMELVDELRKAGGDVVLVDNDDLKSQIADATGRSPIRLALNAVGGENALRIASALAPGGVHVTYGAMGRQPVRIPNGLLIFKDISFRGFWVSRWYQRASRPEIDAMFKEIVPLIKSGMLMSPVEQAYPVTAARAAVEHAAKGKRNGKIIFEMNL